MRSRVPWRGCRTVDAGKELVEALDVEHVAHRHGGKTDEPPGLAVQVALGEHVCDVKGGVGVGDAARRAEAR